MILHPIDDKLVKIRLPVLSKKIDENKIKDAHGRVELKKEEILRRAEKFESTKNLRLAERNSSLRRFGQMFHAGDSTETAFAGLLVFSVELSLPSSSIEIERTKTP